MQNAKPRIQRHKLGNVLLIVPDKKPLDYYVYLHLALTDQRVFYVGKGKGNRCNSVNGRNYLWNRIALVEGVQVLIHSEGLTEDEAYEIEIALIKQYGKLINKTGQLANLADGGPDKPH